MSLDIAPMDAPSITDTLDAAPARDWEAEARAQHWFPKDEYNGPEDKWVDAETFVKRAEESIPLMRKQNADLKRQMAELRRSQKQAAEFFSKAEQRGYERGLAEIEKRHAEAVEVGDVAAASAAVRDLRKAEADHAETMKALQAPDAPEDAPPSPAQLQKEVEAWIERTEWYGPDQAKTTYANMQAELMGNVLSWPGGRDSWFAELEKRVATKFGERKPSQTTGAGSRSPAGGGGRTYVDLPPDAKRMCDKFVKNGVIKSREDYVKSYQWD